MDTDIRGGDHGDNEFLHAELKKIGIGRRYLCERFFNQTYEYCRLFECKGVTVEDEEELCHQLLESFQCNACPEIFDNLFDYQLHYNDLHHLVCSECKKKRPTARLLEIHVQETHDSFFQVMAKKQPMYQCFVTHCDVKFKDHLERRNHCRKVHLFPKRYRYDELDKPKSKKKASDNETPMEIDLIEPVTNKKKSLYLGKNLPKTFTTEKFEIIKPATSTTDDPKPEKKMALVTMFVPTQVRQKSFAKTLTGDKTMEKDVLESESIMDLADSLPTTE
ncbi:hypothetical protein TSAR_007238 [Trichomalopsis sarcophagae]|uniref:C2H2-type domain-containing protein n=1 Tax=Trichomalopsis sarcophagae TaxID=543379 RepID=A0A232F258_9HYME|nr:hypothetical protein TSAR_007238 [Trichomalopsis sarcophagae]